MAVFWIILRGQQIYTDRQAVDRLLNIVSKCHILSVVAWKGQIKYFLKCESALTFMTNCMSKIKQEPADDWGVPFLCSPKPEL